MHSFNFLCKRFGYDLFEVRSRVLITSEMSFKAASMVLLNSGDYPGILGWNTSHTQILLVKRKQNGE